MKEVNSIITIAYRDILKFMRDKMRIVFSFMFPLIFISVLGGSFQANLGSATGFNFMTFIFTGIIAQTLFQSSASGIISLIEDRENDFSQEMFVSPVSRYSIILGKILGESSVAFLQAIGIVVLSFIVGVPMSWLQLLSIIPVGVVACLFGGAFGVLVMSQLNNQRSANQIFPFLIFPQYFLSGALTPIKNLPVYLAVLSKISPMTYAVDIMRSVYYAGKPEYSKVVLNGFAVDIVVIVVLFVVMLGIGTFFFVRNERNK